MNWEVYLFLVAPDVEEKAEKKKTRTDYTR